MNWAITNMHLKQFNFKAYKELGAISLCVFFIPFYINQNQARAESSRPDIIIDLLLKGDYQAALNRTNLGLPLKREASDIAYLKAFIQSAPFMAHFDPVKAITQLHEQPNGADDRSLYFSTLDIAVRNDKNVRKSSVIGYVKKSIEALNRYDLEFTKTEKHLISFANLLLSANSEDPSVEQQQDPCRFDYFRERLDASDQDMDALNSACHRFPAIQMTK